MKSLLQLLPFLLLFAFAPGCAEESGQSTDSQSAEQDSSSSTDEGGEEDSSSSEEGGNEEGGNEEDTTTSEGDTEELDDSSAGEEGGDDVEEVDAGLEEDTEEEDAGGDTEQQPETEEVVDCGNPPASVEACDVIPGSDVFVLHGTVLGPEATYLGGEVVIANGEIKCVGCDCGESQGVDGATRITCGEGIISPGLINAHDHITFTQYPPVEHGDERYDHRHEWRKGLNGKTKLSVTQNFYNKGEVWGELRLLFSGATSVLGSGGEEGFLRNLDKDYLLEGLSKPAAEYDTFPLGDSSGTLSDSGCGAYNLDLGFDIEKEFAYCPHVAEGINEYALNEFFCLSGLVEGSIDVVAPNSAFIHGIGISATEVALMAGEGTGLIWSPRSNISLYGHTASVSLYDLLGAGIALGTDWTASGSMNMLREIQCATYLNDNHLGGYFSDAEIWEMATYNGALLLGYGDILGAIEPNFAADISIFRGGTDTPHRDVLDANVEDVLLVLRGGTPLYGRDSILSNLPGDQDSGCEAIDVCGESQRVCIKRETGETLASLTQGVSGGTFETYPLFFCDTPEKEPSCVPFRPGEFTGEIKDTDSDGDGIQDANDNCPFIFNALRPIDNDVQPDKDGDGVGDVCDPCPFDADTDACTSVNPDDLDGDEIPNSQDNCVNVPNVEQLDEDSDGKGDVCDKCPSYPNPGSKGCLTTIYEVAAGNIPENETVFIEDMVVTAQQGNGFFVQLNPASDAYEGPEFSGIWVYNGGSDFQPTVGTVLSIDASYQLYFGEPELTNPSVTTTGEGVTLEPEVVLPGDIATAGDLSAAYVGVLVSVKDVVVESITPDPAGQSLPTNEFSVTGGLLVDDYFYKIAPFPSEGDTITSITGVMKYSWNNTKLLPRSVDDVVLGPPTLDAFSPEMVFMTENTSGGATPPLVLSLTAPFEVDTTISLSSSAPEIVGFESENFVFPAGQISVEIPLVTGAKSDTPVIVTATHDGKSVTAEVMVVGANDNPTLVSLVPSSNSASPSGTVSFTVTFSSPVPQSGLNLEWTASSTEGDSLNPPVTAGTVQVAGGVFSTAFDVDMPSEPTEILVTVSLDDQSLEATVEVTTLVVGGLVLSEVYYDAPGEDGGKEWIKLYNASGETVDLGGYSLGWGGTDWTYGTLDLSGTVEPWSCVVVGGPTSSDDNGNPSFDISVNIEPDLQNGGSKADGVALFEVPAFELTNQTIPVDVVLYGTENGSNLIGPDGTNAPVHTDDVPSGFSLQRVSLESWTTTENPSPSTCPALLPTP